MTVDVSRRKIADELTPRSVRVRVHDDHTELSFRYMTPGRAKLAVVLTNIVLILLVLCFVSDAVDGIVAQQNKSPLPQLAQHYLAPVYLVHRIYTSASILLVEQFVHAEDARLIAPVLAFIVLIGTRKALAGMRLEPVIWSPLLGKSKKVRFYDDKIQIGSEPFKAQGDLKFECRQARETRERLPRHLFHDLSNEITFTYGARHIEVATVFGHDNAKERQATLQDYAALYYGA